MGRKYCIIQDCLTPPESKNESFHQILSRPEEEKMQWIEFIAKANEGFEYSITQSSVICSGHFQPCCFSHNDPQKRRKINQGHSPTLHNNKSVITSKKSQCFVDPPNEIDQLRLKLLDNEKLLNLARQKISEVESKYQSALKEIKVLKQKLKRADESQKRKMDEIDNLNGELKACKRTKINNDQYLAVSMMHNDNISSNSGDSIRRLFLEILQRKSVSNRIKYPEMLRQFAFQLYYFSPRAYRFLRDELENALPHPRSFQRWLHFIDTKPGIIPISIEYIKMRNLESTHTLYYSLAFDEMNIRQQIIFDDGSFKGYINYGGISFEVSKSDVAKTALFALACEINGNKRIPIGYILTNGLSAELMSTVIQKSLIAMHEVNATVISVTFDGLKSNMAAVEILGANLKVDSALFRSFFHHPASGEKVFVVLDPCHMMKLARNVLRSCQILVDAQGNEVRWKYFPALVNLQEESGVLLLNHLVRHD